MNENDHDLLVSISTKVTSLCSDFQSVKSENREDHQKMNDRLETNIDKKLNAKIFYWLIPFIIAGLLAVGGIASDNHYEIGQNEKAIEMHLDK